MGSRILGIFIALSYLHLTLASESVDRTVCAEAADLEVSKILLHIHFLKTFLQRVFLSAFAFYAFYIRKLNGPNVLFLLFWLINRNPISRYKYLLIPT